MNKSIFIAFSIIFSFFFAFAVSGCNQNLPFAPATETLTPQVAPTEQINPENNLNEESAPSQLILWVPEFLNPSLGTPIVQTFYQRIDDFQLENPNIKISVRVKANAGEASLMNALSAAQNAAPLSLPDLVIFSAENMQIAMATGFVKPLGEAAELNKFGDDWFQIAVDHAVHDGQIYGLPLFMDALVMAYHSEVMDTPPGNWQAAISSGRTLAFPAASPKSLYSLALYLQKTESLLNSDNRISLNESVLTEIFQYFADGEDSNLFPYWLSQYSTDAMSWEAFVEGRSAMAISWISRYLQTPESFSIAPMPSQDGTLFSLSSATLISQINKEEEQNPNIEIFLNYLFDSQFLGQWSKSLNSLPPKQSSLNFWDNDSLEAQASLIIAASEAIPAPTVLNLLGEKLMQYTVDVLKGEKSPETASAELVAKFN